MKKASKVNVYIEWFNYEGKVQSRDWVASFNSINWANKFVENSKSDVDERFSRFVIE